MWCPLQDDTAENQRRLELFKPAFSQLVALICGRVRYPDDWDIWHRDDKDDFMLQRYNVADTLLDATGEGSSVLTYVCYACFGSPTDANMTACPCTAANLSHSCPCMDSDGSLCIGGCCSGFQIGAATQERVSVACQMGWF